MDKRICRAWAENILDFENFINSSIDEKPEILLCLDSYGAHWNKNLDNSYDITKINVLFHKIPEKTTPFLQPLDRLFNHELKLFVKNFENRVMLDDLNIKVNDRLVIMRLWALIWEQFSHEDFSNLIKYCFYKSFLDESLSFKSLKEICFTSEKTICDNEKCLNIFFIKCVFCKKSICLKCFFIDFHSHRNC